MCIRDSFYAFGVSPSELWTARDADRFQRMVRDVSFFPLGSQFGLSLIHICNLWFLYSVSVIRHARNTSATLHAWAVQPRGAKGASPSNISLMLPTPWSFRCCNSGSR